MIPRAVLFAVIATLGAALAASCTKPDDLPRWQDEVRSTAANYQRRYDELRERAEAIEHRRRALPQDTLEAASAQHTLGQARSMIEDRLGLLSGVSAQLKAWVARGDTSELQNRLDEMRHRLETGEVEATAELAAVESWVAIAEQRRGPGAPPPAPEPPPGQEAEPERPADTDASGKPIR